MDLVNTLGSKSACEHNFVNILKKKKKKQTNKQRIYILWPHISILCPDDLKFGIWLQILNKEHEKAEDSKPVAVPATTGS